MSGWTGRLMGPWTKPEPKALALDFDGTLTMNGRPLREELQSQLRDLRSRGKKVILATGRCVADIRRLTGEGLFDGVVAENGALLEVGGTRRVMAADDWRGVRAKLVSQFPEGCEEVIISAPIEMLAKARSMVPPDRAQILVNKDRLMIMPPGVDKGTGLAAAYDLLGLERWETVCVGDGENDLPMFEASGGAVALRNSVEVLKRRANMVVDGSDVEGTMEAVMAIFGQGPAEARGVGP